MIDPKRPAPFMAKAPVFGDDRGRKGIHWRLSAYYYWWEFLRLHEGYAETCRKNGKGKYKALYHDFGDVHASEFKEWWQLRNADGVTRGAVLFAEPHAPAKVEALTKQALGWEFPLARLQHWLRAAPAPGCRAAPCRTRWA